MVHLLQKKRDSELEFLTKFDIFCGQKYSKLLVKLLLFFAQIAAKSAKKNHEIAFSTELMDEPTSVSKKTESSQTKVTVVTTPLLADPAMKLAFNAFPSAPFTHNTLLPFTPHLAFRWEHRQNPFDLLIYRAIPYVIAKRKTMKKIFLSITSLQNGKYQGTEAT